MLVPKSWWKVPWNLFSSRGTNLSISQALGPLLVHFFYMWTGEEGRISHITEVATETQRREETAQTWRRSKCREIQNLDHLPVDTRLLQLNNSVRHECEVFIQRTSHGKVRDQNSWASWPIDNPLQVQNRKLKMLCGTNEAELRLKGLHDMKLWKKCQKWSQQANPVLFTFKLLICTSKHALRGTQCHKC